VRFTESPRHPHVGLERANSPVGPKLKAHVDGSDAQQFIRAAAANNLDRLDAMLKVRPDLVAAPWSYGDARRALHYALMDRAPEMVRMLMRAVEEHSTRVGLPVGPFRLGETVLERGADPLESDAEPWADGLGKKEGSG
jgi:hypothetical protein